MGQGLIKTKLFPGNPSSLNEEKHKRKNQINYQNPEYDIRYQYQNSFPNRAQNKVDLIPPPTRNNYGQIYYEERGLFY